MTPIRWKRTDAGYATRIAGRELAVRKVGHNWATWRYVATVDGIERSRFVRAFDAKRACEELVLGVPA